MEKGRLAHIPVEFMKSIQTSADVYVINRGEFSHIFMLTEKAKEKAVCNSYFCAFSLPKRLISTDTEDKLWTRKSPTGWYALSLQTNIVKRYMIAFAKMCSLTVEFDF